MPHDLAYLLQQVINGLQLASFYMPLAVAFAIMQSITRRIYLSFGDLAMFASFAAVFVCFDRLVEGYGDVLAGGFGLIAAILCGAALGHVIAAIMLGRDLLRAPLSYMIASLGIGIALQEGMRLTSMSRDIWVPPLFSGLSLFRIEGSFPVNVTMMTAVAIAIGLAATLAAVLVLQATRFGLWWQACSQSLRLASLCGIDADQVARWSFALSGALAGVTGWTASISYGGANFSIGLMVGFKAMFASVIGGFGSVRGAILGALFLATVEVAWSAFFSTVYRDVAVFAIIILILVLRPEGLLGLTSTRESEDT